MTREDWTHARTRRWRLRRDLSWYPLDESYLNVRSTDHDNRVDPVEHLHMYMSENYGRFMHIWAANNPHLPPFPGFRLLTLFRMKFSIPPSADNSSVWMN